MAAEKRTAIITGNCQARALRRCLRRTPAGEQYEFVFVRNRGHWGQEEAPPETVERCAILFDQVGHQTSRFESSTPLPADCRIIRYPVVWMNSLWPTYRPDPRNVSVDDDDRGPFPYGDALILRFLDEGLSPAEAVDRWFATDLSRTLNLDRFHQINAAKALQLDKEADVAFGAHVLGRFRREKLFITYNHVAPAMLKHMIKALLDLIGYPGVKPSLHRQVRDGIGPVHAPIHPSVAAHFGLEWYDPDAAYRYFEEQLTAREYLLRYAAFAPLAQPA